MWPAQRVAIWHICLIPYQVFPFISLRKILFYYLLSLSVTTHACSYTETVIFLVTQMWCTLITVKSKRLYSVMSRKNGHLNSSKLNWSKFWWNVQHCCSFGNRMLAANLNPQTGGGKKMTFLFSCFQFQIFFIDLFIGICTAKHPL